MEGKPIDKSVFDSFFGEYSWMFKACSIVAFIMCIYVSPSQIRRFNLRTGDSIAGKIRPPKDQAVFPGCPCCRPWHAPRCARHSETADGHSLRNHPPRHSHRPVPVRSISCCAIHPAATRTRRSSATAPHRSLRSRATALPKHPKLPVFRSVCPPICPRPGSWRWHPCRRRPRRSA